MRRPTPISVPRPTPPIWLAAAVLAAVVTLAVSGRAEMVSSSRGNGRRVTPAETTAIDTGLRGRGLDRAAEQRRGGVSASHLANRPSSVALRFVPGEVIVRFAGGSRGDASRSAASFTGAEGEMAYPERGDFSLMKLAPDVDPEAAARELNARTDVVYAQPNYFRQPLFVPDDPFFNLQWNLIQIGMERAWDVNPGSRDTVIVAVIDSGLAFQDADIDFTADAFTLEGVQYPALGAITVPFAASEDLGDVDRVVAPFDFVWGDENPVDMDGHGTHVSGTIGQATNNNTGVAGVAFNVRLMPLKVLAGEWDVAFGAATVCCGAADADVAEAIRYAVDNGADVINLSLGGPDPSPVIDEAVAFAVNRGVFVALAAGNSFQDGNPTMWPAAAAKDIDGAMAVAAVDRERGHARYSSTGDYIEIAAPGGDSLHDPFDGVIQHTLDPDFALTFQEPLFRFRAPRFDVLALLFFEGTSMASPHVAGVAALLKSQGVGSPAAIEAAIKSTAVDLGETGDDEEFGAGLVDAAALVRGLGLSR